MRGNEGTGNCLAAMGCSCELMVFGRLGMLVFLWSLGNAVLRHQEACHPH